MRSAERFVPKLINQNLLYLCKDIFNGKTAIRCVYHTTKDREMSTRKRLKSCKEHLTSGKNAVRKPYRRGCAGSRSKAEFQLFAPGKHIGAQKTAECNVIYNEDQIRKREGEDFKPGGGDGEKTQDEQHYASTDV